jgi:hypothetical protein
MSADDFDRCFRCWTAAACSEWKWQAPDDRYFRRTYERLPEGLRTLIAHGVATGLIIPHGRQFTLRGLAPSGISEGGDPGGIRTRDLDLERVASLARLDDGVRRSDASRANDIRATRTSQPAKPPPASAGQARGRRRRIFSARYDEKNPA